MVMKAIKCQETHVVFMLLTRSVVSFENTVRDKALIRNAWDGPFVNALKG